MAKIHSDSQVSQSPTNLPTDVPSHYADWVVNLSVNKGVARMMFAEQVFSPDGQELNLRHSFNVLVPVDSLPSIVDYMSAMCDQLRRDGLLKSGEE